MAAPNPGRDDISDFKNLNGDAASSSDGNGSTTSALSSDSDENMEGSSSSAVPTSETDVMEQSSPSEAEEPMESNPCTTNYRGEMGNPPSVPGISSVSSGLRSRTQDRMNLPSSESFPAQGPSLSDLTFHGGSEGEGYTYLCTNTRETLLSAGLPTPADTTKAQSSSQEAVAQQEAAPRGAATNLASTRRSYEDKLWTYLSHSILYLHSRTWFGGEERDRLAINEHFRRITRYAVVDIVILVSWVLADLLHQKRHIGNLMCTSLVYTVMFVGSTTMLLLCFLHVMNRLLLDVTRNISQLQTDPTNFASIEEIISRFQAVEINADACPPSFRWKILYLRNTHKIFADECRLKYFPYTMTSPREMPLVSFILNDLQKIAEINPRRSSLSSVPTVDVGSQTSEAEECSSASRAESSVSEQTPKEQTVEVRKDCSGNPTSTETAGEREDSESSTVGSSNSILRSLLSQPPQQQSTESDPCSGPSTSYSSRVKCSAQDRYSEIIKQKLTTWLGVIRNHFDKLSISEMEQRRKEAGSKLKAEETTTRYSCIKRQKKTGAKPQDEHPKTSGTKESEASPGGSKGPDHSPTHTASLPKQGLSPKGKMSMSLQYRYTKKSKGPESKDETDDTTQIQRSMSSRQSRNLSGKRSRSLPDKNPTEESSSSDETGSSGLHEIAKRSRVRDSAEEYEASREDAGSVAKSPLHLGTPHTSQQGATSVTQNPSGLATPTEESPSTETTQPGQSGHRPAGENEILDILKLSDTEETEYIIRRVPVSLQCEETDPPPEIELLLKVLDFLDYVGFLIRSAVFNRHLLNTEGFREDIIAIKEIFNHCYEVLRSSVIEKGTPCLLLYEETLMKVIENLSPLTETLTGSPAILDLLSKLDDESILKEFY